MLEDLQIIAAKARDLDIQIVVDEIEFLLQSNKGFMLAQKPAKDIAKLQDHDARLVRVVANQRSDRIERVKEKMRIDLTAEGIHARLEQQLLMLLEVHLDPRVIPDFNRHGHRHDRRQHH